MMCSLTFVFYDEISGDRSNSTTPYSSNSISRSNPGDDSIKVNQLLSTSEQMRQKGDYTSAMRYSEEALSIAESNHYAYGEASALNKIGSIYFHQRNYAKAMEFLLASEKISEEHQYTDIIPYNHCYLGAVNVRKRNTEEALEYFKKAIALFEKRADHRGQSECHYLMGFLYRDQGDFDTALLHFNQSLSYAKSIDFTWGIAASQNAIGTVHSMRGAQAEAIIRYDSSMIAYRKLENQRGIGDTYHHIGTIHFRKSDYSKALTNYLAALKIRQQQGDQLKTAESYHDIGHIYLMQGQYDEAQINYTNALKIFKQEGNLQRTGLAYGSLGNLYTDLQNIPLALENFEASIAIQKEINDKPTLLYSYNNIGRMYTSQSEYDKARVNLLAARDLGIELGENENLSLTYQHLAVLSFHLDSMEASKMYGEKSLALAQHTGNKNMLMYNYELLAKVDSAMGNNQEALVHYKLYKLYTDSILSSESEQVIADLKIGYETERKDNEIAQLKNKTEIDSLQFIFQQELLARTQAEKERIHTENLYHLQQIDLLDQEKELQQLQIEKGNADMAAQKAEADHKQNQLALLSKEGEIQAIQLTRQKSLRNYMLAGFVLFVLLSYFAYHYFITRQKLKLQTLRNKIATDLHDDVGSTLSSIAIFSEIAQQQSKEVIPLLQTITDNSRQMLDAMADIVWTIHPENDQLEKITLRMRSYAYELLGAKQIGFDFTADDDIIQVKLPMDVRKNLFLIFKEATNNIVKYSDADKALFSIRSDGDHHLSMEIRDNGKGFDINEPTVGNGLRNIQKRAREVGGKLLIDSLPGKGTVIQLKIAV